MKPHVDRFLAAVATTLFRIAAAIALVVASGCGGSEGPIDAMNDSPAEVSDTPEDLPQDPSPDDSTFDAPSDLPGDLADLPVDTPSDASGDLPPDLPFLTAGRIQVVEERLAYGATASRLEAIFRSVPYPTGQDLVGWNDECVVLKGESLMDPTPCTPPCLAGSTCIRGQCQPIPDVLSAGRITFTGLNAEVRATPGTDGYYPVQTDLPVDLFDTGAEVQATAEGADLPAFTLHAWGVEDLEAQADAIHFQAGTSLQVAWTPAVIPVPGTRIQLRIETGWHGSTHLTTLWCETDDDGTLEVPASLTALVPQVTCGKCEQSWLGRLTREILPTDAGPIELQVISRVAFVPWY